MRARVRERLRLGSHLDVSRFEPGRERIEGRAISHLPAKETRAIGHRSVDDDTLLAVVHPEGEQGVAALHRLQPDQRGAEQPPIVEPIRAESGISQPLQHGVSPFPNPVLAPAISRILRLFWRQSTPQAPLTLARRRGDYAPMSPVARLSRLWWRTL
jgi:hypothetical protein